MNFETLAGLYSSAKIISRVLGNGDNMEEQFKKAMENPFIRSQLSVALQNLDTHLRVMGYDGVPLTIETPPIKW